MALDFSLGAQVGEADDVHVLVSLVCYLRRILGPISPLRRIVIAKDRYGEGSSVTVTVIASEAKQSTSRHDQICAKRILVLAKARVAGRPKPTLCKHGGEAEPAARVFAEDCFASLAMTAPSLRFARDVFLVG